MTVAATHLMTIDELLAIPDDGRRRWLINGELREQEVTIRNWHHSLTMANVAGEINNWRRTLPLPRGLVVCGEAGVRLPGELPTLLGVDVAYVPPDVVVQQTDDTTIIEGVPTLIVEILSPSDKIEELDEMVEACRNAGVKMVWLVDPTDRTVTIYRPGQDATFVNASQELSGDEVLPGFRVLVKQFFE